MHVISLIVRIRLPLVSSQSDQYQKSYGCFSYSDVVGRARSRVKWSIWRAISSTTEQIEMSFGMMAPDILTAIMSKLEVSEFCRAFEFLDWGVHG